MKRQLINNLRLQVPPEVRYFLMRGLLIFVAWQVLYYLVLSPMGIPDKQLTEVTAKSTAFLYQHLVDKNTQVAFSTRPDGITTVYLNNKASISIADPCNALGLYVLYVSILFCFRAPLKRKIIFSIMGCVSIFLLNGIRCFLLAWLYQKKVHFFDFVHHYIFSTIIYVFIFCMWVWFIKKMKNDPPKKVVLT